MHFYYFFCLLLSTDYTDFTDFSLCLEPQTTQTDAKIIYDSYCCNLIFLRVLRILWLILCRPFRSLNLVPRLAVVDGVLSLSSRTAAAGNKNT